MLAYNMSKAKTRGKKHSYLAIVSLMNETMDEVRENICRLCLNYEDNNFSSLEQSYIKKLTTLIPELNLGSPTKLLICSKCKTVIENTLKLKTVLSANTDLIKKEKEKTKSNLIELHTIVKSAENDSDKNICRICFKINDAKYYLTNGGNQELKNILEYCVPELDPTLTVKPAICSSCHNTLCEMYNFKKDCLSVNEKIQSVIDSAAPEDIDLNKVLMMAKVEEESDFLSAFEVKDEEGTDIFDTIPSTQEIPSAQEESRKRQLSESAQNEVQSKREKLMTHEITNEELPHFQMDTNLLYNPKKIDISVEDWLTVVEKYREKFGWSDYTTIHKVLVKLKPLQELYIWFSNIADIMNWEQWKKKLARAFPPKNDYHVMMKKMMIRKRGKEETFVTYYTEKMKLLEPLNLTDEQKVSCIFGGITDVLVCCVGRVGDYKKPEDLVDYFKSCDDKRSVEAAANVNKPIPVGNAQNPTGKPVLQQQTVVPDQGKAGKKRKKCTNCQRYGHSAQACRDYGIGEHMDRLEKIKQQNNPNTSQALARQVKKAKTKPNSAANQAIVVCAYCRKRGHSENQCRHNPHNANVKAKQRARQPNRSPKPKGNAGELCTSCHQPGHTIVNCYQEWTKRVNAHYNPISPPQPKQGGGGNSGWSRCRDCGKYSHKADPCCSAKTGHSSSYIGSYSAQDDFNREICLRCYEMGHSTDECPKRSRWN